jgi:phosphotriesterase-related protein
MTTVATVRGPVDSADLGVTLIHEHLCFAAPPEWRQKAFDYQVELARAAVAVGVETIVDLTPVPDVASVLELQERVPALHLVLSTGAYLQGAPWTAAVADLDEEAMARRMLRNLTEGYEGFEDTGVRAGIIKVASNTPQLTDWEKKNFRAAARVQQEAGVPIAFHSCSGCREQMAYVRRHGANIAATFYSHIEAEFGWEGRTREEEAAYLAEVCEAGGALQFNNFDFEFDTPLEDFVFLLNHLEDRGVGDRLLISIDANWELDDEGRIWHEAQRKHPECGRRTYAYAVTDAVPMLMRSGVSLQRVSRYLIDNPRGLFERAGA